MKEFVKPLIEIIFIENDEIICSSGLDPINGSFGPEDEDIRPFPFGF